MRTLLGGLLIVITAALLGCSSGSSAATARETVAPEEAVVAAPAPVDVATEPAVAEPAATKKKAGKVVVLDPGHGGDEVGAAANGVVEKDSNLDMAFRIEKLLVDQGFEVLLTRRENKRTAAQIPGYTAARSDIQARIDLANAAGADVFVSLHSNGSTDMSQRGVEVWYDGSRPFADENRRLADLLRQHVIGSLRTYGYPAQDRGLLDGACFRFRNGRCFSLFVLGGPRATSRQEIERQGGNPEALGFKGVETIYSQAPQMPGALIELLIITNQSDAAILRTASARDAMARGISDGIVEFLSGQASQ